MRRKTQRNSGAWKRKRAKALTQAQAEGLTNCPLCRVPLDYNQSQRPNSPELDHIIPYSVAGTHDVPTRIICRRCNQRLGAKLGNQRKKIHNSPVQNITF